MQSELANPIVSHSFDPLGSKFNQNDLNSTDASSGIKTSNKKRGKAKVIVKSSLFEGATRATANESLEHDSKEG